jgi:hypothetical protein
MAAPATLPGWWPSLASEDGSFITGQVISCDGGMLAHQPTFTGELESKLVS